MSRTFRRVAGKALTVLAMLFIVLGAVTSALADLVMGERTDG